MAKTCGLVGENGGGATGEGTHEVIRRVEGSAHTLAHDLRQDLAGHYDVGHLGPPTGIAREAFETKGESQTT